MLQNGTKMSKLENRSLDRGIMIMEALARCGASTLADLHRECGIPKSTIRRLLGTLQARRIARRSLADKKYRLNITLPSSVGVPIPAGIAQYIDVAIPILSDLTSRINWPSDIQLLDGDAMRVADSTRPLSPYHLYRGIVNRRLNIFGSATGLSCLASMSDADIKARIQATAGDNVWGLSRFGLTSDEYFKEIVRTRSRGYGIRLATYVGETVLDDRLSAIALPVFRSDKVFGAVSLLFPRGFESTESFAEKYLNDLAKAAKQFSVDLDQFA
jgi:IclR family transcriptional regulator, mhp operon transcriptional activator